MPHYAFSGSLVREVTLDQRFRLGTKVIVEATLDDEGEQEYTYVQNVDAIPIPAGQVAVRDPATQTRPAYEAIRGGLDADSQAVIGVTQVGLLALEYGFVLTRGVGIVDATGAALTVGVAIKTLAAGVVGDAGATQGAVIGLALTGGATATERAHLDCPGG